MFSPQHRRWRIKVVNSAWNSLFWSWKIWRTESTPGFSVCGSCSTAVSNNMQRPLALNSSVTTRCTTKGGSLSLCVHTVPYFILGTMWQSWLLPSLTLLTGSMFCAHSLWYCCEPIVAWSDIQTWLPMISLAGGHMVSSEPCLGALGGFMCMWMVVPCQSANPQLCNALTVSSCMM